MITCLALDCFRINFIWFDHLHVSLNFKTKKCMKIIFLLGKFGFSPQSNLYLAVYAACAMIMKL